VCNDETVGGSDPDQGRRGGERGGAGAGAQGQAAGGARGARRHVGGAPGAHPGDPGGLRGPPRREAEPDRRRRNRGAGGRHGGGPHPAAAGRAHGGRPASQRTRGRAVPRGVAGRLRLRAALQPDGGRGHRGDQPRPELAVAAARRGAGRRRRRGARHAGAARARHGGGDGQDPGRGGAQAVPAGEVRGGREDLQPAVHGAGARRLPDAGRVQPHRGVPSRRCVALQTLSVVCAACSVGTAWLLP
jgi:hypothetical protein